MKKLLIIFEMANNHMGDVQHGIKLVREFGSVCRKYPQFKFILRNLTTEKVIKNYASLIVNLKNTRIAIIRFVAYEFFDQMIILKI